MALGNGSVALGKPDSKRVTASSQPGRICEADRCSTILSIYNHLSWCSVHESPISRAATSPRL